MILSPRPAAPYKMRAIPLFVALAIVGVAGPTEAQVFRWTDPESGRLVISNTPPPTSVKAERVRKAVDESQPQADGANKETASDNKDKPSTSETKKEEGKNAALCASTREDIAQLESDRPLASVDGKALEGEARAAELARSRDILRLFCSKR